MSYTNPRNLDELKQYIKYRLGAPVLEINVSDEQMDIAINDGFAYYFNRSHYNGTERHYMGVRVEQPFLDWWDTKTLESVTQSTDPKVYADGMVDTITFISAGTQYPALTSDSGTRIDVATTATSGSGTGLTVNLGEERTTDGGLVDGQVTISKAGSGYQVGDTFTINGYNSSTGTPATFSVGTIKTSSAINATQTFEFQNNYLILPDSVLSVSNVMLKSDYNSVGGMAGVPGVAFFNPFLVGGANGGAGCGNMHYDLTSYYTMQQYLATLNFMMFPPISYNFNQRTHRLYLNTESFNGIGLNDYLVFEVTTYPDPDTFPQMYSDFWLKEYWVNLVKYQWGVNLSKYSNVQLPGGITLNGEAIKQEAAQELQQMRDRFAMDCADYPLDMVGQEITPLFYHNKGVSANPSILLYTFCDTSAAIFHLSRRFSYALICDTCFYT